MSSGQTVPNTEREDVWPIAIYPLFDGVLTRLNEDYRVYKLHNLQNEVSNCVPKLHLSDYLNMKNFSGALFTERERERESP
jgi:hypothetical protein